MKKGTFQRPANILLWLIIAKIMTTQSDTDISRVKVCLIYIFLTNMMFDLEKIMLENMVRVRQLGVVANITKYDQSTAEDAPCWGKFLDFDMPWERWVP